MTWRVAWSGTVGLILLSAAFAAFSAAVSAWNYPGGHALYRLHSLVTPELVGLKPSGGGQYQNNLADTHGNLTVHVGVLPAMTGVSRFGELGSPWQYSKVGVSGHAICFRKLLVLESLQSGGLHANPQNDSFPSLSVASMAQSTTVFWRAEKGPCDAHRFSLA